MSARALGGIALAALVVAALPACKSSDAPPDESPDGGCGLLTQRTADPACTACLQAKCDPPLAACFGPGWASGDFSGSPCPAFLDCACRCADQPCFEQCSLDHPCTVCGDQVNDCATKKCAVECEGRTGRDAARPDTVGDGLAESGADADRDAPADVTPDAKADVTVDATPDAPIDAPPDGRGDAFDAAGFLDAAGFDVPGDARDAADVDADGDAP